MAFGQAQEAHAELVATANAALGGAEGVDMTTLRGLFSEGVNSPSSRFKASLFGFCCLSCNSNAIYSLLLYNEKALLV